MWLFLTFVLSNLLVLGTDINKEMPEWRKKCIQVSIKWITYIGTRFHLFISDDEKQVDADYSHYLGPEWRKELAAYKKPVPTIVANHQGILDVWLLLRSHWFPGFLAKQSNQKSMIGAQCDALQCLYVKRLGSKTHKQDVLTQLAERQQAIQAGQFARLVIFPESFTTNGSSIARFKHGAFYSLLPVQPMVLLYSGYPEKPVMSCLTMASSGIYLFLCTLYGH